MNAAFAADPVLRPALAIAKGIRTMPLVSAAALALRTRTTMVFAMTWMTA
jgi:hypothetical protein